MSLTAERVIARPATLPQIEERHLTPVREDPRPEFSALDLLGRLLLFGVGFGLAFTGWMLVMSVILVFIGLPLFIFGLAVMQAALPSLTGLK
jgi:hypothetical protein